MAIAAGSNRVMDVFITEYGADADLGLTSVLLRNDGDTTTEHTFVKVDDVAQADGSGNTVRIYHYRMIDTLTSLTAGNYKVKVAYANSLEQHATAAHRRWSSTPVLIRPWRRTG